ncbi:MAG TPA: type II toxin-antitoxin system HicB family antitoxin [Candidatus Ozemobacteraceae bacterium]|nr:type II toxin-antitoxin system HicB family antitoxin [Candidatus Ozemobacteraceae bacterium]
MDDNTVLAYVYWKDGDMWLGYLQDYPDYMTQGESPEELQKNLIDIYKDLTSGDIPCVRKVARLKVA